MHCFLKFLSVYRWKLLSLFTTTTTFDTPTLQQFFAKFYSCTSLNSRKCHHNVNDKSQLKFAILRSTANNSRIVWPMLLCFATDETIPKTLEYIEFLSKVQWMMHQNAWQAATKITMCPCVWNYICGGRTLWNSKAVFISIGLVFFSFVFYFFWFILLFHFTFHFVLFHFIPFHLMHMSLHLIVFNCDFDSLFFLHFPSWCGFVLCHAVDRWCAFVLLPLLLMAAGDVLCWLLLHLFCLLHLPLYHSFVNC